MKRRHSLWALAFFAWTASAQATDESARPVLDCARANVPPAVRIQDIEINVSDQAGTLRTLKGRLYATRNLADDGTPGLTHAMLRIDAPDNLAGAAYLVRETDDYLRDGMYVYLPSVRRVRRITGTFADGALMGTSFSYYDFKQLNSAFGDLSAVVEGQARVEGRSMHVLRFNALEGAETRYSSVRVWIDEKTCVPLKAEFFESDKLLKRMRAPAAALRKSGESWYVAELEMEDLQQRTRTVLRVLDVKVSDDLPRRLFDPNLFYRGG